MAIIFDSRNLETTDEFYMLKDPQINPPRMRLVTVHVDGQHGDKLLRREMRGRQIIVEGAFLDDAFAFSDYKTLENFLIGSLATAPTDFAASAVSEKTLQFDHISSDTYTNVVVEAVDVVKWILNLPKILRITFYQSRPFIS